MNEMTDAPEDRETAESVPERPPEPPATPVVGHALSYARDPLGYVRRTVEEYGPVVSVEMPRREGTLLADPAAIERVLAGNADNYRKGEFQRRELEGLLGDGLLIAEGEAWEDARQTIQPAFYPGRITNYAATMVDRTDRMIADWSPGETVDVADATSQITLAVLGEVLFDVDFSEATAIREAARAVTNRFAPDGRLPVYVPDWVPLPRNRRYRQAIDQLDAFVADLIERRRNPSGAVAGSDGDRNETPTDLVSMLLAAGMDDDEVRDHLVTFLLAGHETTALALTYTLFCLARNPDEQATVAAEVTALDGRPTATDDLPRTDRAIREAMRLYPPVHLVMREAINDDVVAGYHVPAGSLVLCSQWGTHRRPTLFANPETFRPSRWGSADAPDYAYFPFGGGPRVCIGRRFALLEARLVLATILQSFRVDPVTTDLDLAASMTLAPTHPVEMRLVERDGNQINTAGDSFDSTTDPN